MAVRSMLEPVLKVLVGHTGASREGGADGPSFRFFRLDFTGGVETSASSAAALLCWLTVGRRGLAFGSLLAVDTLGVVAGAASVGAAVGGATDPLGPDGGRDGLPGGLNMAGPLVVVAFVSEFVLAVGGGGLIGPAAGL